jgi:hypothetical protein
MRLKRTYFYQADKAVGQSKKNCIQGSSRNARALWMQYIPDNLRKPSRVQSALTPGQQDLAARPTPVMPEPESDQSVRGFVLDETLAIWRVKKHTRPGRMLHEEPLAASPSTRIA